MTCSQSAAGILPADLTLPECDTMPDGFRTFRIADRIIIQFDLPAGCRKHFVARPQPPSRPGPGILILEPLMKNREEVPMVKFHP